MGDNLNAPGATNSVVETFKVGADLFLGTQTKALRSQPTKWVPAAKRADSSTFLLQSDGHSTCKKGLQESRRLTVGELVHCGDQST
jgi:hypothetical protein